MTTPHVAERFVEGVGRESSLRAGVEARLDLVAEGGDRRSVFEVEDCVLVHPFWDVARLRVADTARPIPLRTTHPEAGNEVVETAFPMLDPLQSSDLQQQAFNGMFGVKHVALGRVMYRRVVQSYGEPVLAMAYDSSTLGVRSGGAVVDAATGTVLGLTFGGVYLEGNYAVPSAELARDPQSVDTGVLFEGALPEGPCPWQEKWDRLLD